MNISPLILSWIWLPHSTSTGIVFGGEYFGYEISNMKFFKKPDEPWLIIIFSPEEIFLFEKCYQFQIAFDRVKNLNALKFLEPTETQI